MFWLAYGLIAPLVGGVIGGVGYVLLYEGPAALGKALIASVGGIGFFYLFGAIPAVITGGVIGHLEKKNGPTEVLHSIFVSGLVSTVWAIFIIGPIAGMTQKAGAAGHAVAVFILLGIVSGAVCWRLTRWIPVTRASERVEAPPQLPSYERPRSDRR